MWRPSDRRAPGAHWCALIVVCLVLAAATPAMAQDRRPRPVPTVAIPQREPNPGGPHGTAGTGLCDDPAQQPSISLTLSSEEVFPGDRVTLTWSVRPRVFRPDGHPELAGGGSWRWDVGLQADFTVDPPLHSNPVGASGRHVFTIPAQGRQGNVTLTTFCGQETVHFRVARAPSVYLVTPETGAAGTVVWLSGTEFGEHQGDSRVELSFWRNVVPMDLRSWSDELIEVSVPADAPRGEAGITVRKGGRLDSRPRPFRVLGAQLISDQDVQDVAGYLGLGQTAVRLHRGDNGCTVDFSAALNQQGVDDTSFAGPRMVRAVGDAFEDMVSTLLTGGFFPKRVYYELNDFNSDRVDIALDGAALTLDVAFESKGKELIGDIETCSVLMPASCERVDRLAPDVDLDNAVITIRAGLGLANRRIQVTSITTGFEADVRFGGGGLDQDLIEAVTDFSERRVRTEVERGIDDAVDTPEVRRAIADAVMDQLESLGIRRIVSLAAVGHDLRVEYE